ncbi:hypothetical protein V8E55_001117 [Tylopilus felleus]
MSTTTLSSPSFSIPLFTQLIHRLRHTNSRYDHIAYQCRRTQRPTHHAQRRARCVGLRIDTTKAHAAFQRFGPEAQVHVHVVDDDSAAMTRALSFFDSPSPLWEATAETETETEDGEEHAYTPEILEHSKMLPRATTLALSPLDLGLRTIGDLPFVNLDLGAVPGAPRWRPRPLPDSDSDETCDEGMDSEMSRTYGLARRGLGRGVILGAHASDPLMSTMPINMLYYNTGLGIAVPPRRLKRKLGDVDVDGSIMDARFREVAVFDDGLSFGARYHGAQRRP